MRKIIEAAALAVSTVVASTAASAAVVVNIDQVGADVVVTAGGTLDLTGMTKTDVLSGGSVVAGKYAFLLVGDGGLYTGYAGITGPTSFGKGSDKYTFKQSGAGVGVNGVSTNFQILVPVGYVSGSPLAGTATFVRRTIDSLELDRGVYTFNLPNDTFVVNIRGGAGPVPEPATWAMMIVGFGMVGAGMRRRSNLSLA